MAVAASCPQSESKLASPIPRTPGVSHRPVFFAGDVSLMDSWPFDFPRYRTLSTEPSGRDAPAESIQSATHGGAEQGIKGRSQIRALRRREIEDAGGAATSDP